MQAYMHAVGENNDFKAEIEKAASEGWGQTPALSCPTGILNPRC